MQREDFRRGSAYKASAALAATAYGKRSLLFDSRVVIDALLVGTASYKGRCNLLSKCTAFLQVFCSSVCWSCSDQPAEVLKARPILRLR